MRIEVVERTLDEDGQVVEPVSLALVKKHLRALGDLEDDLLTQYLQAAREWSESYCERKWIDTTVDIFLDRWEVDRFGVQRLPLGGVTEVVGVFYRPSDESAEVEWDSTKYRWTSGSPGKITPVDAFPATSSALEPIRIRAVSGYSDPGVVPAKVKQCLLLLVAASSEWREPFTAGAINRLPFDYESLLRQEKWRLSLIHI